MHIKTSFQYDAFTSTSSKYASGEEDFLGIFGKHLTSAEAALTHAHVDDTLRLGSISVPAA